MNAATVLKNAALAFLRWSDCVRTLASVVVFVNVYLLKCAFFFSFRQLVFNLICMQWTIPEWGRKRICVENFSKHALTTNKKIRTQNIFILFFATKTHLHRNGEHRTNEGHTKKKNQHDFPNVCLYLVEFVSEHFWPPSFAPAPFRLHYFQCSRSFWFQSERIFCGWNLFNGFIATLPFDAHCSPPVIRIHTIHAITHQP